MSSLPGSQKSRSYLESLQARVYSQNPALDSPAPNLDGAILEEVIEKQREYMDVAAWEKLREQVKARIQEGNALSLPTKYESVGGYNILRSLDEQIVNAAKMARMTIPARPLLGTLPTGRVNAVAISLSEQDNIVLFERGLFVFANLLSKAVALCVPFEIKDKFLSFKMGAPVVTDEAVERFRELLIAYLFFGNTHEARQYVPTAAVRTLSSPLRHSMELFVLGHEYGHIICGHFGNAVPTHVEIAGADLQELVRNWTQEYEADVVGLVLMLRAMLEGKYDVALSYWGADLFFSGIEIVERTISIMRTGREDALHLDSHPPAYLRRAALRSALTQVVEDSQPVTSACSLADNVQKIVETMWQNTVPIIHELRGRNIPLAAGWN